MAEKHLVVVHAGRSVMHVKSEEVPVEGDYITDGRAGTPSYLVLKRVFVVGTDNKLDSITLHCGIGVIY